MNYFFLWTFVPCSIALPFIVGLLNLRSLKKSDQVIFGYITVGGMVNVVTSILASNSINNMPLFHFFTIVEFSILSFFFVLVHDKRGYTLLSISILIAFTIASLLNTWFIQSIFTFNTYSRSLEAVIVICYCIYFFSCVIKPENEFNHPLIWYAAGLFIYFSTSFIIFVISNIALQLNKSQDWILWHIHGAMVVVMYLFITKGFSIAKHGR